MKVFLGGTCNGYDWRKEIGRLLQCDFFNPLVDDWTPECVETENIEKEKKCNIHFYLINGNMTGVYSIAELIDSCHTKNKITIFHVMPDGFDEGQLRSLKAVVGMVKSLGGIAYISEDLNKSVRILNELTRNM